MASWRSEIQLPAPEVHRITAVLPLVLERARRLPVADGTLLDPWNGDHPLDLHVVEGTHPLRGTRYEGTHRAVVDEIDPVETGDDTGAAANDAQGPSGTVDTWPEVVEHRWAVTVDADDHEVAAVTIIDGVGTDDEIQLTVEVPTPVNATEVAFVALLPVSPDGFMAGDIEAKGTVTWQAVRAATTGTHRVATVHIGHPRFRAGIVADIEPEGDHWRLTAEGFVSGRGIARPLFGLMMFFVARKFRPLLDRRLAELAEPVEQWNELCRVHERDDDLADALVDQWLDHFRRA